MIILVASRTGVFRIVLGRILAALAVALLAAGALTSQTNQSIDFEVLVLSGTKPAARSIVWVEGWESGNDHRDASQVLGPLKTNELGQARFSLNSPGGFEIFAKYEEGELGLGTWRLQPNGKFQGVNQVTLHLQKTKSVEGQVFFEGKPLAGVQCQLDSINSPTRNDTKNPALIDYRYAGISASLRGLSPSTKTDAEGRFSLGGVPEEGWASILINAKGLGVGHCYPTSKFPMNVELLPGGSLELAIEGEANAVTIKKIDMRLTTVKGDFRFGPEGRPYVDMIPGTPIDRGAFTVPGVAGYVAGTRWLSIPLDPSLSYHFGFDQKVDIHPGKTTKVVLKKIPVGVCSGRIVDATTGKGIPHLSFVLKGGEKWRGERHTRDFYERYSGKTDAEGNYAVPCKGKLVYILDFGEPGDNHTDYELPDWEEVVKRWIPFIPHAAVADGEKVRLRDVSLAPSRSVKGIVRDASGSVVDGPYEVRCPTRPGRQQKPAQVNQGQFTLSQLTPKLPLKFFVRKGKAVNLPTVIPLNQLDKALELTISEKNQVSCSGRIVNAKREPIPGANVTLNWLTELQREEIFSQGPRKSVNQDLEFLKTDEQGRFTMDGLWPDEQFFVRVEALESYSVKLSHSATIFLGLSCRNLKGLVQLAESHFDDGAHECLTVWSDAVAV